MDMKSKNTDLLRPEDAPGGIVESLSFPQHDVRSDPMAVQKHHEALIATQLTAPPC